MIALQNFQDYADFVPGALCVVLREFCIYVIAEYGATRGGDVLLVGEHFLVTQGYFTHLCPHYYDARDGVHTYTGFEIMCREKIWSPSTGVIQYPSVYARVIA